jgi:hypothetical protein
MAICYIFWLFGILFPVLVCCSKKNLATLIWTIFHEISFEMCDKGCQSLFGNVHQNE